MDIMRWEIMVSKNEVSIIIGTPRPNQYLPQSDMVLLARQGEVPIVYIMTIPCGIDA